MPLTLPPGITPAPYYFAPKDALTRTRITRYRFDLLDDTEDLIGVVKSVIPSGNVEWSAYASVKGGGTMNVRDIGQPIDWLNVRIRPTVVLDNPGSDPTEVPLGVFLAAAPTEQWDQIGRAWAVELADKCSILDTDIPTFPTGQPYSFTASAGDNVITWVVFLITGVGEATPAIQPDALAVLPGPLVWPTGTTRLTIINDMLAVVGYSSLWCDGQGQYQTTRYVDPGLRAPVYAAAAPFSKSEFSTMSPDWSRDNNIYDIPNRYVCVAQGNGATEGISEWATNVDSTSPYSYQARGRWITRTVTGVEADGRTTLQLRARQGLAQATAITSGITANHLFLPDLLVNSTVQFTNPDAGLDFRCTVTRTSVPFNPLTLCSSDLRQVVV